MTDETKLFSAGAPKPDTGEAAPAPLESTQAPLESQVQEALVEEQEIEAASEEKTILLNRARMMGLSVSNNTGIPTLKAKIAEKIAADNAKNEQAAAAHQNDEPEPEEEEEVVEVVETQPAATSVAAPPQALDRVEAQPAVTKVRKKSLMAHLHNEQMRLVRVRIANLDPKKRDLKGEMFTVANDYIGSVRKFIPYGEGSEDGYHIPVCILNQLKARTFQDIREVKNKKTGLPEAKTMDVREFAIEELPPLSQEELDQLAAAQLANGSLND